MDISTAIVAAAFVSGVSFTFVLIRSYLAPIVAYGCLCLILCAEIEPCFTPCFMREWLLIDLAVLGVGLFGEWIHTHLSNTSSWGIAGCTAGTLLGALCGVSACWMSAFALGGTLAGECLRLRWWRQTFRRSVRLGAQHVVVTVLAPAFTASETTFYYHEACAHLGMPTLRQLVFG